MARLHLAVAGVDQVGLEPGEIVPLSGLDVHEVSMTPSLLVSFLAAHRASLNACAALISCLAGRKLSHELLILYHLPVSGSHLFCR